jgi:hypothetical protein
MIKDISLSGLGLAGDFLGSSTAFLSTIYRAALNRYAEDPESWKVVERIIAESEQRPIQEVFTTVSEDDVAILSKFAESFYNDGNVQIAAQLFHFLTLLCPDGSPHPITYMHLAESISELSIDSGLQIYDFILKIFPDHPAILLAAARRYGEGERPKRALSLLDHAKEVSQRETGNDPASQKFLALFNPELEKIQQEILSRE